MQAIENEKKTPFSGMCSYVILIVNKIYTENIKARNSYVLYKKNFFKKKYGNHKLLEA